MRTVRGIAALIVLAGLLIGIPAGLIAFGGNPFPDTWSWQALGRSLLRPASDRALIRIVTIIGWVAWAGFAASAIAETVNALSGRRVIAGRRIHLRVPGLGGGQKFAAILIVAVISMIAVPHTPPVADAAPRTPTANPTATVTTPAEPSPATASAPDPPVPATLGTATPVDSPARPATKPEPRQRDAPATHSTPRASTVEHVVERGDWLWTLADRYLGDGARWRDIAAANPGIDPNRLAVGQHLTIPIPAHQTHHGDARTATDNGGDQLVTPRTGDTVTVERGDSLSEISDDLYGTPRHWPDLYRHNRDQISDPDEIEIGQKLELPGRAHLADTDHPIHHTKPTAGTTQTAARTHPTVEPTPPHTHRPDPAGDSADAPAPTTGHAPHHQPAAPPTATAPPPTMNPAQPGHNQRAQQPAAPAPTVPATTAPAPSAAASDGPARPAQTAPVEPAPVETAPVETAPAASAREPAGVTVTTTEAGAAAVGVGLLLAAGLINTLNDRRRRQLRARRPGRRILTPSAEAAQLEEAVKTQHQRLRVDQLDQVTRAIAAHCHHTGADLPALSAVRVADHRMDFLFSRPADTAPPPGIDIAADGSVWTLPADQLTTVLDIDGIDDATPPYPALVTLGRDADTAHILIDLEAAAALTIAADTDETATAMLATIALELAVSPWAGDLTLTFVGPAAAGLAEGLDHPAVTHADDIEPVLADLEARAAAQRGYLDDTTVGQKRADPELADAWCPHIVLIGQPLTTDQADRLTRIVTDLPRVAIAAVTTNADVTPWRFHIDGEVGHLTPHEWQLTPQLVTPEQYRHVLELLTTSGAEDTTPAPWWDHDTNHAVEPNERDDITTIPSLELVDTDLPEPGIAARTGQKQDTEPTPDRPPARPPLSLRALTGTGHSTHRRPAQTAHHSAADRIDLSTLTPPTTSHPMLRIFGEPDLIGARGASGQRYQRRSLEFMLFLLEHPGATSTRLRNTFCITRDYTKAIISNLRKTLGADPDGNPYLPELGRQPGYRFHDQVTSDWLYAQRLIGRGVNVAPTEALLRILSMVRGRPLEGADDWIDTQTLRTDIESTLSDIAHELVDRALDDHDLPMARWATQRGLTACPESETLLTDQLRTERQAGNTPAVHRLADRISANARALGVDLLDETMETLREAAM